MSEPGEEDRDLMDQLHLLVGQLEERGLFFDRFTTVQGATWELSRDK